MTDDLWARIQAELSERSVGAFDPTGELTLSEAENFGEALARIISYHLAWGTFDERSAHSIRDILDTQSQIAHEVAADLMAVFERDQACKSLSEVLLFRKGFQALSAYRIARGALFRGRDHLSIAIQHRCNCVLGADIHPLLLPRLHKE